MIRNLEGKIDDLLKQYERKAHAGWCPNDRGDNRKLESKIKQMNTVELSEFMPGDCSGIDVSTKTVVELSKDT